MFLSSCRCPCWTKLHSPDWRPLRPTRSSHKMPKPTADNGKLRMNHSRLQLRLQSERPCVPSFASSRICWTEESHATSLALIPMHLDSKFRLWRELLQTRCQPLDDDDDIQEKPSPNRLNLISSSHGPLLALFLEFRTSLGMKRVEIRFSPRKPSQHRRLHHGDSVSYLNGL
jgi:hypothetical protein